MLGCMQDKPQSLDGSRQSLKGLNLPGVQYQLLELGRQSWELFQNVRIAYVEDLQFRWNMVERGDGSSLKIEFLQVVRKMLDRIKVSTTPKIEFLKAPGEFLQSNRRTELKPERPQRIRSITKI